MTTPDNTLADDAALREAIEVAVCRILGVITGSRKPMRAIGVADVLLPLIAARETPLHAQIAALEAERDEAQRDNIDMMWQRRRAEERADDAEAERDRMREALEKLRPLSEKATPGRWFDGIINSITDSEDCAIACAPSPRSPQGSAHHKQWQADRSFIAASANLVRSELAALATADASPATDGEGER